MTDTCSISSNSTYLSTFTTKEEEPSHILVDYAFSNGIKEYNLDFILKRLSKYFLGDESQFLIDYFISLKRKKLYIEDFLIENKYHLCFIFTMLELYIQGKIIFYFYFVVLIIWLNCMNYNLICL